MVARPDSNLGVPMSASHASQPSAAAVPLPADQAERLSVKMELALDHHTARANRYVESDDEVGEALRRRSERACYQIRQALDRFEAGTFGVCRTCRQQIDTERLDALPHASTCATCAGDGRHGSKLGVDRP